MTIQAAIDLIDSLKPNMFSDQQKVAWLSELDGMIWREVIKTHEGYHAGIDFAGYDQDTEMDTVLLAPEPYSDLYKHWLASRMDVSNRDNNEYAKDMVLFNNAFQTLCNYWNRTYMPISLVRQLKL